MLSVNEFNQYNEILEEDITLLGNLKNNGELENQVDSNNNVEERHHNEEYPAESNEQCNLIVNYLPHDIDDNTLKDLFSEWGEIVMTKVVRDKNTKKSLGYGFVKFQHEEEALYAIQKMNGFQIDHKFLKVSVARPPSLEIRNCKLYVTNLPKDYSEMEIMELFSEFGQIIECRLLKDKMTKLNKGVAFVQFNLKSQANNALSLNGYVLDGSNRGLVVKYAEDQHKKKELFRLSNLTSTSYRDNNYSGNMYQNNDQQQSQQQKFRMDHQKQEIAAQQAFYFQQQHGINQNVYNSPIAGPLQMVHSPMNNAMYLNQQPSPHNEQRLGGNGLGFRGNAVGGRKQPENIQQNNNWYNSMPQQMVQQTPTYLMQAPQNNVNRQNPQQQQRDINSMQQQHQGMQGMNMPLLTPVNQNPNLNNPQGSGGINVNNNNIPTHLRPQQVQQQVQVQQQQRLRQQVQIPNNSSSNNTTSSDQQASFSSGVSISITNLPPVTEASMLHDIFAPYGRILSAQIEVSDPSKNTGDARSSGGKAVCAGKGKIVISSLAQAETAVQALNGVTVFEGYGPIQVSVNMNSAGVNALR